MESSRNITPEDVVDTYNTLDAEKGTFKSHLQEIADYMVPEGQNVTNQPTMGGKRMSKIYDGTAIRALRIFANGMYGNLSPLSTPWFIVTAKDKRVAEMSNAKFWLADTTERMRNAVNASNAPLALHEIYKAEGWAGTGVLYTDEGRRYAINCQTFSIGNCCITEDAEGVVDGLFRLEKFTARQCIQKWGKKCSAKIVKAFNDGKKNEIFEIIHGVFRRNEYDWRKIDAVNMPYASMYCERLTMNPLEEGGFHEFPYAVPRWEKTSGEAYGRSCGMDALPDTKMLNQMCYDNMRGVQKSIDPPIFAPSEASLSTNNTRAGGIIFYKSGHKPETLNSNGRFDIALEVENGRRDAVKMSFYNDLFQLLAQDPTNEKTAYEISKRLEENISILGPALGRQQTELFDPFLSRVFSIMLRKGLFLPPPPELVDQGLAIEYVGRLALAMKSQETQATGVVLNFVSPLAEAKPEILDNFDVDEIVQGTATRAGMPIKYLVAPEVRDQRRQERAEQLAKQQQSAELQAVAQQLPNLSKAPEPGSMAAQVLNQGAA